MNAAVLRSTVRTSLHEKWGDRFDVTFHLREKTAPECLPTGLSGIAIPRGTLTEIHGPASSGRTSILYAALARATGSYGARGPECCALIDAGDSFDPQSAADAGVCLPWLLWVRCGGSAEHALKAADLVIQAGGFGVVALDLAGVAERDVRRISLASWFRLRNAVEKTSTALIVIGEELTSHPCSTLQIRTGSGGHKMRGNLLRGLRVETTSGPRIRKQAEFALQPLYRE